MRSERCALCGQRLHPWDGKDAHAGCIDGRLPDGWEEEGDGPWAEEPPEEEP